MIALKDIRGLNKILEKRKNRKQRIVEKVSKIIKRVREEGDKAVIEYTRKFDKVKLSPKELRISESEISSAFNELDSQLISAFKLAMDNVFKFYRHQVCKPINLKEPNGKLIKVKYVPIERLGIYVPSGTAPLVSTVYMCAIPALVAGVKELVVVSPVRQDKSVNPFILAVSSMLKIKEMYKIGGAQAIAALAFGTKTIKKVDKIVGPGNEFVTEAKRQVFGQVDIDMLAGPSEVVIIAGKSTRVDYIIADLEAQIEHHNGLGIVITNSRRLFNELKKVDTKGFVIKVRNLDEAIDIANRIAPEHLEILTSQPSSLLRKISNSGAIFLGENTPVALGDYLAGPSHVLPTTGSARFFSSLSLRDFLKEVHIISYTKKAISEEFSALEKIASLEGMSKHIESVKRRL
ncbi:MAG: histidinol dehydrogenase [Candidatus Omnitrophica bacterium]|nr:histidinol dehydrogenase [Candidatus Omnitrophota bacterium]